MCSGVMYTSVDIFAIDTMEALASIIGPNPRSAILQVPAFPMSTSRVFHVQMAAVEEGEGKALCRCQQMLAAPWNATQMVSADAT